MVSEFEGSENQPNAFVGAFDARTHFANLLNRVERGEVLTITRNHRPVALLSPAPTSQRLPSSPAALLQQFRDFRAAHPLEGLLTREMIDDGRRL